VITATWPVRSEATNALKRSVNLASSGLVSTALLVPHVNTATMSAFLRRLSEDVARTGRDDVAVVIMDQAGWHVSKHLEVPENIWIVLLPSYSLGLNPVENLWHWIKSHHTSNRTYAGYDDLLDGVGTAWRSLSKRRLRSVCRCEYLTPGRQP
jgi:transposase